MKKIILFAFCLPSIMAMAQNFDNLPFDDEHKKYTGDGGSLSLNADKYLLEPGEADMLTVRINWIDPEPDGPIPKQYDYRFKDPANAPWKITKWEIIEGGGELRTDDQKYYASYTAPTPMPSYKSVTIAVTMMPNDPTKPKVILLKTIYLEDNENVFYFNCPAYGAMEEKYVVKDNGGIFNTPNTSQARQHGSAQQNQQLDQLQQQLQQAQQRAKDAAGGRNLDLGSLTSNLKAVYDGQKDLTTIVVLGTDVAMIKGKPANSKKEYQIVFSFPGQGPGVFKIKGRAENAASVVLVHQKACGCDYDPNSHEKEPPCSGGIIRITKYDAKPGGYIEGTITANLVGNVGEQTIFGDLDGKFKVKLAMQN